MGWLQREKRVPLKGWGLVMQGQGEQGIDFLCQRLKGPGSNLHRPYAYLLFADACGKFNRIGIEPSDFYTLDKVPARCDNSHLSIYGTSPECAFL
jgi:hypothetical protein